MARSAQLVGPLEFDVDLPGYLPSRVHAFAEPCDPEIPIHFVDLQPESSEFGFLDVSYSGLPDGDANWGEAGNELARILDVENLDTGESDRFVLPAKSVEATPLGPIPYGRYRLTARFAGGHRWPASQGATDPVVLDSASTPVSVDMSGSGTFELQPSGPDGDPYHGMLEVRLYRGHELDEQGRESWQSMSGPWLFSRPPYVIPGLSPGTYHDRVAQPLRPDPDDVARIEVEIGSSARTVRGVSLHHGSQR